MGTYATTTSLETLVVGVTFDTATTSLAGQCIVWAENEIDKKLSNRYDVSSFKTTVPPIITTICEQLSLGYFWENSSRGSKESLTRADKLIKRAMDNLDALAKGNLAVADTSGSVIADRIGDSGVLCNTSDYNNTFNEADPLNWAIDSTKLSDIDSQ
jgi:hypothetical protein